MANGILRCGEKGVCDIWEKWVSGWRNGHLMEAALDEPLHGVRREGEEGLDARGDRRALEEAEHRVAGVDEAEMVLRVGSLADEKTLLGARQAVHRMRLLLDDVTRLSRELKCEPQHVYGHVLHRLGFPVDRESRELPLERLVGLPRAREMCAGVSEIRNLLRIKVQDNNDLRLAQTALCETTNFFERLDAFAAKKNKTPAEVLAAQANGGKA